MAAPISFLDKVFHGNLVLTAETASATPDGPTGDLRQSAVTVSVRGTGTGTQDLASRCFYYKHANWWVLIADRWHAGTGTTTVRYQVIRWNVGV